MHLRFLTVSSIYYPCRESITAPLPFIRISGLWLNQAGFHVGDRISVQVRKARLTIIKVDPEKAVVSSNRKGGTDGR